MSFFFNNKEELKVDKIDKTYKCSVKNHEIVFELKQISQVTMNGENQIVDENVLHNNMEEIARVLERGSTKYQPVPKSIKISYGQDSRAAEDQGHGVLSKESKEIEQYKPVDSDVTLKQVYLDKECEDEIKNALLLIQERKKIQEEWGLGLQGISSRGIVLNFYGKPGTGKSHAAKAIANELGKQILIVNYAELESKYVGETPKNIKKVFEVAKEKDAVIVFDEADAFLGKRIENVTASADYGVNITRSVMLIELENFDGVIIFTTNLFQNYDSAFKRRILSNIEFKLPDCIGRKRLWELHIPQKLPLDHITAEELAKKFDGISGADIKDMILMATVNCIREKRECVNLDDFENAYNNVKKRYQETDTFQKVNVISEEKISEEQYQNEMRECK